MEFQKIETLLDRYFEGASSLEEEKVLRRYFSGSEIDDRLQEYAPLFQLFALEQKRELKEQRAEIIKRNVLSTPANGIRLISKPLSWALRIAAVLVLALGIWWAYHEPSAEVETASVDWSKYEITDEKEAFRITGNALLTVSKTLNDGAKTAAGELDRMQEIGKFFK